MADVTRGQTSWEQEKQALERQLQLLQNENVTLRQQLGENLGASVIEMKDTIGDGVYILDREWRIVYMNRSAKLAGWSEPEELVGKNFWEYAPGLVGTAIEGRFRLAMESGVPCHFESRSASRDRWYTVSVNPHRNGVSVYFADCTEKKQAEQALQESEKKYRELVKFAPAGIYSVDLTANRFTSVNDVVCLLTGYSREELLQMRPLDLVDEHSQQLFLKRLVQFMTGERPDPNVEYKVIAKDRHTIDVILNTTFITDENGNPCGATVVCHDITERKRIERALQESEKQYREMVQFAPTGIYEVDFRGKRFVSVNDTICLVTGYTRDELMEMNPLDLLDKRSQEVFQRRIAQWLAGEKPDQSVEYKIITKDGREIDAVLYTSFTVDENGQSLGATVVAHDITERKHMEEALRKSEVEFRNLAARLEQSNRELESFAFIASHDLQEPLRKINSFGERVIARIGGQIDDESRHDLDRMLDASLRMQKMIDGLLALSRVTTHAQPFVAVDLGQVAEAVVSDLEGRILESCGQVLISELPEMMADPVQLGQLLQNLISNALKFCDPGISPRVEVYAEVIPPAGDSARGQVKVFVKDNGIGFDEKYAQRIFQPFERLVGRSIYEGSGIGLAICKKIVDRHGGTITAESKPGAGSTFIVCLPLQSE